MINQNVDLFDNGEEINLEGVLDNYEARIYSKNIIADKLPEKAIVGFSKSSNESGKWEHDFESIFSTTDVAGEIEKFRQSLSATNIIIINKELPKFGRIDNLNDLRKKHIK